MTRRDLVWAAAYTDAWRNLKGLTRFVDVRTEGKGEAPYRVEATPYTPAEIARMCAARADACVAGLETLATNGGE